MTTLVTMLLALPLLAACVGRKVVLTNATSQDITLTWTSMSSEYRRQPVEQHQYRWLQTGVTEQMDYFLGYPIDISDGKRVRSYQSRSVPDAYVYTPEDGGLFETQIVRATFKDDGCIHLATPDPDRPGMDLPQPAGFPLCPEKTTFVPPPPEPGPDPDTVVDAALIARIREWSCPAPAGAEHIKPLYALDPKDGERIREARERAELQRRKTHASWDAAFAAFTRAQADFASVHAAPDSLQIEMLKHADATTPRPGARESFATFYTHMERRYDKLCARRSAAVETMLADEPALAALRREPNPPWLQPKNRISCAVAPVRHCKPSD